MTRRRDLILGSAAAAAAALCLPRLAAATDFPDHPIRLVVPFPPGGNLDFTARLLAPTMSRVLGQPIVVDNRAGAGGILGSEAVAHGRPDGYTLLVGSSGPLSLLPVTTPNLPFDPVRDFAPIGPAYRIPIVLLASRNLSANSLATFLELAKMRRGQLSAGSSGIGTGAHLAIELFNHGSGVQLLHVPYRGTGPAYSDLIAGTIDTLFDQLSNALPLHRDGRARILAVGSAERVPELPDVPTLREAGIVQPELSTTIGLLAPAGTPAAAVEALRAALAMALADGVVRERLESLGAEIATPDDVTPARYAALIQEELATSRAAVALPGVKLE
ncbi:tripartite-type tricarboxylate transporter receptor subunit TctC [Humitalea rosea]|uniref:Tripartite-type tricarboxylate transporter receptor subunit TctC n=1 Tax=Humitalea rosea TaxID=990373 RepID=A0A2W7HWB8_9PROT|nr:tripartite tricarboxylate transporter substrate binding protein [Humitalea rosea]PZW38956.1 tripartite-type tricarboxylate transporter receptor subunit TctC [Humitalea rosea]